MKYNGFYFWMFKSPMKKVLAEKYGREYAADIMKKSKKVYRELVEKADDIGDDILASFGHRKTLLSLILADGYYDGFKSRHRDEYTDSGASDLLLPK